MTKSRIASLFKYRGLTFALIACLPVVILYAIFYLVPLGVTVVTSFFKWDRILIEGFIGFENYQRLFSDPIFYRSLTNILIWIAVAVFIHIPMCLMVAMILSTKLRGWQVMRTLLFIPQIISGVAWATIFISVFNPSFGLLNGFLQLIGLENLQRNWLFDPITAWPSIIATWLFFIGLYTMIMLAELLSIPEEVYEAATVDGASGIQLALYIKLPLLRLVTGTCLILTISGGLRYFDGLYIMTNGAPNFRTQTLALYLFQQYTHAKFAYANAIGTVMLVLGIILILTVMKLTRSNESDF